MRSGRTEGATTDTNRFSVPYPFWLMLCVALLITAPAVAEPITTRQLSGLIEGGSAPALILDVRTPAEFALGHVPGAVNIPIHQLGRRWREIAAYRDQELVLYCQNGPRAQVSGRYLDQLGFVNIRPLHGHMYQWLKEGLPVEKGG